MALIKFNKRKPWMSSGFTDFIDRDDFFNDDFWEKQILNQPALNIKESEDDFEIEVAVPGLSKDDLKVSIDDGYLNIRGEKEETKEEKKTNFTRKEFSYNSFKRSLLLPDSVKQDGVKAIYDKGILHLFLTKKEEEKGRSTIDVEVR